MKKLVIKEALRRAGVAVAVAVAVAGCSGGGSSTETNTAGGAEKELTVKEAAELTEIKFAEETFDFGKIKQGDKVTHDFAFTNTGKQPLIISEARASCGCTVPEPPKEPIKPGAKGVIKVVFSSEGKSGLQDKQVYVTANTNPQQTIVHLIGEVETK